MAAYVGAWLIFAIDLWVRIQTGADARICPVGSQDLTDWCTMAEVAGSYLFVFLWALYGLPLAFVFALLPAVALGRLAPTLERNLDGQKLNRIQLALAAAVGAIVMLGFAYTTGEKSVSTLTIVGLLAGVAGALAFQRARYTR